MTPGVRNVCARIVGNIYQMLVSGYRDHHVLVCKNLDDDCIHLIDHLRALLLASRSICYHLIQIKVGYISLTLHLSIWVSLSVLFSSSL